MYCCDAPGLWITKVETTLDKHIKIIDLDGTFVSVNTFHGWMKFLFIQTVKKFQFISSLKILVVIALRYTKRIDHATMKYKILQISENISTQKQIQSFVTQLNPYVHQKLLSIVQDSDTVTILATAAPLFYAKSIKKMYGFDFVFATPSTTDIPWQENIRTHKAKNIQTLFMQHHWKIEHATLYTDHYDDMPLMKLVSSTCLIDASKKTKQKVEDGQIKMVSLDEPY